MTDQTLDRGTYDVVRQRLDAQGTALAEAVAALDGKRRALFGGTTTELVATHRVRTEHQCIPRDLVQLGDRFLLGCDVVLGLKSRMTPGDVFIELVERDGELHAGSPTLLADAKFEKDFAELFQYYKDARLLHLRTTDTRLLMVFQAGTRLSDIKVLRWALERHAEATRLRYLDNQGDKDYGFPPAHDFTWTRATRDLHVMGAHPHVNLLDTIFVECVGGDLTVKIENNTATGQGIYSEPVDDQTQGLDDAELFFAALESAILLKIRPYRERDWRYLVYNRQTREVVRLDVIGQGCQQLPEGHGLIFPGGYYLADGTLKRFPVDTDGLEYKRMLRSPAGEDVAYVFYRRDLGTYLLLGYHLINREVAQPLACHSWCRLDDGRMYLLRNDSDPTRVHTIQVWRTPFCRDEHWAADEQRRAANGEGGLLRKLGNRELVRAVSDATQIRRLIANQQPTRTIYDDLLKRIARVVDGYPWLGDPVAGGIRDRLGEVRATANIALDEFEKVQQLTASAAAQVQGMTQQVDQALKEVLSADKSQLSGYVDGLTKLKARRGAVASLRTVRHVDATALDRLEHRLARTSDELSQQAVAYLLKDEALTAYQQTIAGLQDAGARAATVAEATPILEQLTTQAQGLDLLVEVVNGLAIADATQRTAILERIAGVYGAAGTAKAVTINRRRALGSGEAKAGYAVQAQLLTQAVASALSLCDTPERCDELAAKQLTQVEELEARFADWPEFVSDLAGKRAEIADAFTGRKQQLADERARRADGLASAGTRLLTTIGKRLAQAESVDALNAYLAADPLVAKLHQVIADLRALGAVVKADDLAGKVKVAKEHGLRGLRDRGELFDGADVVKLGRHRFSVNRTPLALTVLPRSVDSVPQLVLHLSGTDYESAVTDPTIRDFSDCWDQHLESETAQVYRGEYLAWTIAIGTDPQVLAETARDEAMLLELVRRWCAEHYDQGYERGIHDLDGAKILMALLHLREAGGLLRFMAADRAAAQVIWAKQPDPAFARECRSLDQLRQTLGETPAWAALVARAPGSANPGSAYLCEELARNATPTFIRSHEAAELLARFSDWLRIRSLDATLRDELTTLGGEAHRLAHAWVQAFAEREQPALVAAVPEVVAELVHPELSRETVSARTTVVVEGVLGSHPRIDQGRMTLRLDEFSARLSGFVAARAPRFRTWQQAKATLIADAQRHLRLAEFAPNVLSSFVRNTLVNEVFLPLIGDNLAKQIGTVDAGRRTDQQGLLLLISPPGYGKTTLVEYVAAVLGLALVKINGPTLGHTVTSLDPAAAPNAAARQEVERVNLALAMGNNVALYVDDIQHTNPEFLQKFISLCDGTRRIDGVWNGASRTFDLRGKRFAVIMAGNPYTESGEQFRVPDMLANRADTYNLGDIIGGRREAFERSYLENCLVANPILNPLTARPPQDLFRFIRLAGGDDGARGELEHPYTAAEVQEITAVIRHLVHIQRMLLLVNQAYIASAQQSEDTRSEPPCKIQGSYRTMGKLAAKVVPAMTDDEVVRLVLDQYRQEAQTLTTGAEANLLKAKQLFGLLTPEEQQRWDELCRLYRRKQELLGGKDDPMSIAVAQLAKLADGLVRLREDLSTAQATPAAITRVADTLANLAPAITAALDRASAAPAETDSQPKVEIINTLPKYYAQLYQHHLAVIEHSLVPVLDLLGKYVDSTQQTKQSLGMIAQDLRKVLGKAGTASEIRLDPER